jgi:DNA-directed RNA polymerase subunit RPC12/RpoP
MEISFNCTNCGQKLEANERGAGITIDCPKCHKPVYIPSRPVVSAAQSPMKVTLNLAQPSSSLPPAIEGSLQCVVFAAILLIVAFTLYRSGLVVGMIFYAIAIPFQIGALLCAVFGICHGSIKHGLALLAAVGLLCALNIIGPLWFQAKAVTTMGPIMEDQQKQMEQLLKQFHQ